jgi:hypothetical protein
MDLQRRDIKRLFAFQEDDGGYILPSPELKVLNYFSRIATNCAAVDVVFACEIHK